MRQKFVSTLMIMLLANTFIVSAWADVCMDGPSSSITQDITASIEASSPCHGDATPQTQEHCKGVCLCIHASLQQTPVLPQLDTMAWASAGDKRIQGPQAHHNSLAIDPPQRPPIIIS